MCKPWKNYVNNTYISWNMEQKKAIGEICDSCSIASIFVCVVILIFFPRNYNPQNFRNIKYYLFLTLMFTYIFFWTGLFNLSLGLGKSLFLYLLHLEFYWHLYYTYDNLSSLPKDPKRTPRWENRNTWDRWESCDLL